MSRTLRVLLASALLVLGANAQAVTASFTVTADYDPYSAYTQGYCENGQCMGCYDPWCFFPFFYGYGSISNPYLPDGRKVVTFVESTSPSPSTTDIRIFIFTLTDPGANYVTNVSIDCDGGTENFSPVGGYGGGGIAMYTLPTSSQCMSYGNTYTVIFN